MSVALPRTFLRKHMASRAHHEFCSDEHHENAAVTYLDLDHNCSINKSVRRLEACPSPVLVFHAT